MGSKRDVETHWAVLGWAALAVGAGCGLLVALGAPSRMPTMNGVALLVALVGTALLALGRRFGTSALGDIALLVASALLPLTALIGPEASGVSRWLVIGGLTIQPALIVLPLVALGTALAPSPLRTAAAVIAALGLAMQPDPGGAAMLFAGLAAPSLLRDRRGPIDLAGGLAAAIAFAIAQWRTVELPPVPFVEHVLPDAIAAGLVPALLAIATAVLMLIPAVARPLLAPHLAFLGLWIAALIMALVGPYPTPVVGFGGSGVLGFVLSAGLLALGTGASRRHRIRLG